MARPGPVILERQFVPQNTLVMKEGEVGANAFLIQSGSVEVFTDSKGGSVHLAKLGMGQIFGEMALIFDEPRAASVRTLEDCNLIVITRQAFKDKLNKTDTTIKALVQMFAKRLVASNNIRINKANDMNDLLDTVQIIYQNALLSVPYEHKKIFEATAGEKLEEFLAEVQAFKNRYGEVD